MFEKLKSLLDNKHAKSFMDVRNLGLYIFAVIVLAIAWSTAKTVQSNYDLQKQISVLKQQNDVLELENRNSSLKNQYLQSDQYLDLAARQSLGLAAPGEKVMIVPKAVAMKYIDQPLASQTIRTTQTAADNRSRYAKNLEAWRDFLLGRKLTIE